MERYEDKEIHYAKKTDADKVLAYSPQFKIGIENYPSLMSESKEIIDACVQELITVGDLEGGVVNMETENISVSQICRTETTARFYFKVVNKKDGNEYFVKVTQHPEQIHGGPRELLTTVQLKEDLAGLDGVRVGEGCLAFKGAKFNYYVSKYENSLKERLGPKLQRIRENNEPKYKELMDRLMALEDALNQ